MKQYYLYAITKTLALINHGSTWIDENGIIRSGINDGCPIEDCCSFYLLGEKQLSKEEIWRQFFAAVGE